VHRARRVLGPSLLFKDDLTRSIVASVAGDLRRTRDAFRDDGRTCIPGLEETATAPAARAAPDCAGAFEQFPIAVCAGVAKASGTSGAEASQDEAIALGAITAALGA